MVRFRPPGTLESQLSTLAVLGRQGGSQRVGKSEWVTCMIMIWNCPGCGATDLALLDEPA